MFRKYPSLSLKLGCSGTITGAVIALIPVVAGIFDYKVNTFRLPILILAAAGALHSIGYLRGHGEERGGIYFFFYNLTAAAMLAVTLVIRPLHFLVMWEVMSMASFMLVCFDYKNGKTVRAAWIYLLACQAGSLFLMAMFLLAESPLAIFLLALAGFGLKIGFPLFHVWLPEAHPAAPAPVSSLMSGAMIQLGFFGILQWGLRTGVPEACGITLLVLGITGSLGGILFSLPRTNIKTMLAYSSIENMGIISLGLGLGFLGAQHGNISMTFCGFAGAFLHMINHALLKGGLFLLAGGILKATGSLEMDRMGGLLKRMPKSGFLFLLNSAGLSGLPPFNAFISEFLIYLGAFSALASGGILMTATGILVPVILALTGGIAAAAFSKVSSAVFLGEPRSEAAADAVELPRSMILPPAILFLLACCVTVFAPVLIGLCIPEEWQPQLSWIIHPLRMVSALSIVFTGIVLLLLLFKFTLPRGRVVRHSCTWDCGFSKPDARMQYTGSAFIQPLELFCTRLLRLKKTLVTPKGDFPSSASYQAEVFDPVLEGFWAKLFHLVIRLAEKIHSLQSGSLHFYILVMTAALILMLVWGLLLPWSGTLFKGAL